jgi:hypothetical protein
MLLIFRWHRFAHSNLWSAKGLFIFFFFLVSDKGLVIFYSCSSASLYEQYYRLRYMKVLSICSSIEWVNTINWLYHFLHLSISATNCSFLVPTLTYMDFTDNDSNTHAFLWPTYKKMMFCLCIFRFSSYDLTKTRLYAQGFSHAWLQ